MQDCDVYIGRRMTMGGWKLKDSAWFNPFKLADYENSREKVLERYENWIRNERPDLMKRLSELENKTLGCWCKPKSCHGDVLVRLVKEMQHKRN